MPRIACFGLANPFRPRLGFRMAYVEVWKEGVLVSGRPLDEEKARVGVAIRLGPARQAAINAGQTTSS